MKRNNIAIIRDINNIPLEKKVKIESLMEQSLQDIYQNSTEFNSIMSFSEYIDYFNNYLKYRNSHLFKSLPIDLLLQINNFIEIKEKLTMIYVCKNWFEKFYNNDYFWKYLLSLLKIENDIDTNQIRNFLIFKYKYYNYFKKEERNFMECSSDNSILSNFNENSIPLKFNDNFYFNGEFKYYSGWYGCGGGSTAKSYQTDLFGIYFEPLSLQYIFVKLEIYIDYDNGREESNNTEFSFVVYKSDEENFEKLKRRKKIINYYDSSDSDLSENEEEEKNMEEQNEEEEEKSKKKQDFSDDEEEEEKKSINEKKKVEEEEDKEEETPKRERKNEKETMLNVFYMDYQHKFYIFNEELRKLVREWLKLSENGVKNEKEWLKEFIENKIPKEAKCKEIFERWPLFDDNEFSEIKYEEDEELSQE